MKIADFVECELQMFRDKCNFTPDELMYFNLRAQDHSNVEVAYIMNVSESKVSQLARKVKKKMIRVL